MKEKTLNTMVLWIVIVMLFLVILVLIVGMYSGLMEYEFSDPFINALGTFSGALAGATLAGIFSLRVFNKNMEYEEQKKENEQSIKKAIYLNEYLRLCRETMEKMRDLNYSFIDVYRKRKFKESEPSMYKAEYEFRLYSPILDLYKNSKDEIKESIILLERTLEGLSYDTIHDYEFLKNIKFHQSLLKKILRDFSNLSTITEIKKFEDLWILKDCIAGTQEYLRSYEIFEDALRKMTQ